VEEGSPRTQERPDLGVAPGGTETILIAEDDSLVRTMARAVLESKGYQVLEAATAEGARTIGAQYDGVNNLLISDLVLPDLNGRELSERFVKSRPGATLLFISGYAQDVIDRHGVKQGQTAFLQKPFSPSALADKVRGLLDAASETQRRG
jgi:DNA-binding response OmpR family regulator